jgi:mannose-1-phosphate guanylyltransferase
MVLCAGLGQRLRPLTDELPKPLLPVLDRSVLGHIGARLRAHGRLDAVANTHWKHDKFDNIGEDLGVTLNLIHEPRIRGVAGAVGGARAWLRAPVLVWSGDILIDQPPLAELVARAERSGGLCLAVAPAQGAGTVGLDAAGRMVRVRGQVHGEEVLGADYVSLFAAGERALAEFPEEGCLFDDYCLPRMRRGESIETCWVSGRWWDIGTPERYLQTNLDWLSRVHGFGGNFLAPSAQVDPRVTLASSVVGRGARVNGTGRVERCVIWPESVAQAPLSDCIVTPSAVLQLGRSALP